MIEVLDEYYRGSGIHSLAFSCPHRSCCANGAPDFSEAKSSYVGTKYEARTLPRLLFLSLDAVVDTDCRDAELRTAQGVQNLTQISEQQWKTWKQEHPGQQY